MFISYGAGVSVLPVVHRKPTWYNAFITWNKLKNSLKIGLWKVKGKDKLEMECIRQSLRFQSRKNLGCSPTKTPRGHKYGRMKTVNVRASKYEDKLKTYSAGLVWGHTLCSDFYHTNKKLDEFNSYLQETCGHQIHSINKFNKEALYDRCELLFNLVKLIWNVK